MLQPRRSTTRRRGTASVELAVAMLVIGPVLLGVLEVGRIVEVQQILVNAAREGGRQASTGQLTNAQVTPLVITYLNAAGLNTAHASVTIQDATSPGTDASAAAQLDRLTVTVTIPFADVHWVSVQLVTNSNTNLTGQTTWVSLKDLPYASASAPPIE